MAKQKTAKPGPSQVHLPFNAIETGLSEETLQFRLVHFWEARNPTKGGLLIGLELLLIDDKSSVIQGFVAPHRIGRFEGKLKRGSIYKLSNFYDSRNKNMYRVTDHKYTVCFTDKSTLSEIFDPNLVIDSDRFRFHSFAQFQSNCDRKSDIYDIIGHLQLINGQNLSQTHEIGAPPESQKERVSVHLQAKEGPVLNIYLWDNAAAEFRRKFTSYETIPTVLLVTTVNPKNIGGRLSLSSMSSSRVFFDKEFPSTREYLTWLGTLGENLPSVDASQVTKVETLTIAEVLQFLKTAPAEVHISCPDSTHEQVQLMTNSILLFCFSILKNPQKACFNCVATIDHINEESGWYYIGCTGCNTKFSKGPSTFVCAKCNNPNAMGVIKLRLDFTVHDAESEATFVFLDEAGSNLIGRKAVELMDDFIQANGEMGENQEIPLPSCLSEVHGQTHTFQLTIAAYNFGATRQTFTVTKLINPETPVQGDTNTNTQPEDLNPTQEEVDHSTEDTTTSIGQRETGKGMDESTEDPSNVFKRARLAA